MFNRKRVMGIGLSIVLGMSSVSVYASESGEVMAEETVELGEASVEKTAGQEEVPEENDGITPVPAVDELDLNVTRNQSAPERFDDVQEGRYYYTAVYWALENNITTGTSQTTFSPEDDCTRAQTVTFLWRAAGKPEPMSMDTGFVDVVKGSFYEKAVAWALESGVTTGTSPTTFSPNDTCTRAEFVTFLHRSAGKPDPHSTNTRFTDLEAGRFYEKAVAWAVENGVTTGTSPTTFSPNNTCTRGQVVSFLYRWYTNTTVSVIDFGAVPDDAGDDTDAFNKAFEQEGAETIYVPAGTYVIDAEKGIRPKSNKSLIMDPGAVLDVTGNSRGTYNVINIRNVQNVSISGGQIRGERNKHTGTSGESGMGIGIYDGINISISDVSISGNWGDGIYLGTMADKDDIYGCDNIRIENCTIFNNRRSNISIVDADNVAIDRCTISDAKGTAPQCGINIEPNRDSSGRIPEDAICKHIRITNTTINVLGKDDYYGQYFCFMTAYYPGDKSMNTADDMIIDSCTLNGDCGNYSGTNVTVSNTVIRGTFYDYQGTKLENVSYENIWRG